MASRICQTCGLTLPATSRFCRNCGTSLDRPVSAGEPPAPPPPYGIPQSGYGAMPAPGMPPVPAYGGPPSINAHAPWSSAGVWRQKNMLVMHKNATLPDRCVKCNRPANGRKLTKKFMWHHPAYFLLILAGFLIYLIAALIVRKPVTLHLGLCDEHFSKRRTAIWASWGILALSVALIILGAANNLPALVLIGFLLIFVAAIYGVLSANLIAIQKVDDHYVWLKRINKDYLMMLPELP
jgi:Double zinc ribbon